MTEEVTMEESATKMLACLAEVINKELATNFEQPMYFCLTIFENAERPQAAYITNAEALTLAKALQEMGTAIELKHTPAASPNLN